MTIACLVCLGWYGFLKYQIMSEYDDTSIMVSIKELEYNDTQILTDRMNFNVAFGITYYDGDKEPIENPNIGTMKAIYREWGLGDYSGVLETELETRPCTMEDFGLQDYEEGDQLPDPDSEDVDNTNKTGYFFTPV